MKPNHRQSTIRHRSGRPIAVDAKIAPLLAALWNEGIDTANSCEEEEPGVIWIEFEAFEGLRRFLEMVVSRLSLRNEGREDMYDRMTGLRPDRNFWRYTTNLYGDRLQAGEEWREVSDSDHGRSSGARTTVSLRFPARDYQLVYELFQEARERPILADDEKQGTYRKE